VTSSLSVFQIVTHQANQVQITTSAYTIRIDQSRAALPGRRHALSKQNENGLDDLQSILNVLHECNNGNRVVFSKNEKYIIGTALDVRFLNHIDIGNDNAHLEMNKLTHLTDIQGDIQFTDNTDYWQAESLTWLRK